MDIYGLAKLKGMRWSRLGAQKQDVYFLSHECRKEQKDAG
jgi:hypothetical protein